MDDVLTHRSWNRDRDQERKHLVQADRLIAKLNKRIARQSLIVQAAVEKGRSRIEAESLLRALNEGRRALEKHRQRILDLQTNNGDPNAELALRSPKPPPNRPDDTSAASSNQVAAQRAAGSDFWPKDFPLG